MSTPTTMRAAAIEKFGGPDELAVRSVPVPELAANEVLIRVECAGVASWDPFEREGGFAQMFGQTPSFPYICGTDAAGTVAAVGAGVTRLKPGDRACCAVLASPKGGCYADFVAAPEDSCCRVPDAMPTGQAAVMLSDALTGLDGLHKVLQIKPGESLMIFGAGGGIGHMAVQLAKRLGARVFAVASGDDGVELCRGLGADAVANGRKDDVVAAARSFAPHGLDAALMTAGGEAADRAMTAVREGGRVAHPDGVMPTPHAPAQVRMQNYSVEVTASSIDRLVELINAGPFTVHIARTFTLEQAADAHRFLDQHYLGKVALKVS